MSAVTLQDFEPHSECGEPLSDAQIKAIRNMAYYRWLLMVGQGKSSADEEAAFFNGVMCAFFACRSNLEIPASWMMSNLSTIDRLNAWKRDGELTHGG